jgi:hypothetical protein
MQSSEIEGVESKTRRDTAPEAPTLDANQIGASSVLNEGKSTVSPSEFSSAEKLPKVDLWTHWHQKGSISGECLEFHDTFSFVVRDTRANA